MGKAKSFAEKMLKGLKKAEENVCYRVLKPINSQKGTVRFQSRIVTIHKGEDEKKILGV